MTITWLPLDTNYLVTWLSHVWPKTFQRASFPRVYTHTFLERTLIHTPCTPNKTYQYLCSLSLSLLSPRPTGVWSHTGALQLSSDWFKEEWITWHHRGDRCGGVVQSPVSAGGQLPWPWDHWTNHETGVWGGSEGEKDGERERGRGREGGREGGRKGRRNTNRRLMLCLLHCLVWRQLSGSSNQQWRQYLKQHSQISCVAMSRKHELFSLTHSLLWLMKNSCA